MTQQEIKRVAAWVASIILVPLAVWGFHRFDASKVESSQYRTDQVRDSAWKASALERLNYVACRQDFPRVRCLPSNQRP